MGIRRKGAETRTQTGSKWFIRHMLLYDASLCLTGDVPCVVPLFACVA
jgi:hypothetical protein